MDLSKFKSKKVNIEKLVEAAKAETTQKKQQDERFWRPTVDKAGNGYAVIRFLPTAGDDLPWTRFWDHAFQGPTGQWLIEKSLTSLGKDCPISEANSVLWNSGSDENKEIARDRKRRQHFVSNIYVVSDTSNPSSEGNVYLYSFGKKIFDKIIESMNPQFEDETPLNPFDLWEGADFALKIRNVAGYRNYDKSEFKKPSALFDGDEEKLSAVCEKLYSLAEFTDPAQYKSYEELEKKLNQVLGTSKMGAAALAKLDEKFDDGDIPFDTKESPSIPSHHADESEASEAEDAMSYFNKIAADE